MNWIQENKFLAGFIAVLLLGVIGGGYMAYSAYGKYDEITQTFDKEAREYNRLRTLKPYPDQKNLAELKTAKETYATSITSLQKTLAALVLPNEEMKTQEFQDRLNKTVLAVRARAAKVVVPNVTLNAPAGITGKLLPDRFYLDFDKYQNELPKNELAAAALNRQLKTLEFVANELIAARVDAVTLFKRGQMPEETGNPAPPKPTSGRGKGAAVPVAPLVVKRTLDIGFVSDATSFRRVLNMLATSKKQFFIVRSLQVRNSETKGPSRGGLEGAAPPAEPVPGVPGGPVPAVPPAPIPPTPTQAPTPEMTLAQASPARPVAPAAARPVTPAAVAPVAPAAPAPAGVAPAPAGLPEAPATPKYIVGEEKVIVIMKLEIVDFPAVQIK